MGLLSSIGKAVSKVGTAVKNAGVVVAQSTGVAKLWGDTAKPTVNPSVAKIPVIGGIAKALVTHPYTTAAVVATPITSVGKTAVSAVAKSVVKAAATKPLTTAAVAVVAAPIIAGTIVKDPNKAITAAANAPSAVANFEKNIYEAAKNPSISSITNIVKENPILSAAVVAIPAAAALKAASIPAALAANNILGDSTKVIQPAAPIQTPAQAPATATAAATTPITPQTIPLVATAGSSSRTSRKRKKAAIKPSVASMRQNLSVIIQNKNQNVSLTKKERIIKRELLAY